MDYTLTILGITISVILTIGIFYWNFRKDRKRLSYQIITDNQLIDKTLSAHNIKISHKGKEVDDFRLFIIKIVNDGYKTIHKNEFDEEISVFFGIKAEILLAELVNKVPDNLKVNFNELGNTLQVQSLMLNRGDYFIIKLLVSNSKRIDLKPEARISGVPKLTLLKDSNLIKLANKLGYWFAVGGLLLTGVGFIILMMIKFSHGSSLFGLNEINSLFIMVIGVVSMVISIVSVKLERYLKKSSF